MKNLKRIAAFAVLFALLITALIPITSMASEPTEPEPSGPTEPEPSDPSTDAELVEADPKEKEVSAEAVTPNKPDYTMLCGANVKFTFTATNSAATSDSSANWTYKWSVTEDSANQLAEEEDGLSITVNGKDLKKAGTTTYVCTATRSGASATEGAPRAYFQIWTIGGKLTMTSGSKFSVHASADRFPDGGNGGILEVAFQEPTSTELSAVNVGPEEVGSLTYNWTNAGLGDDWKPTKMNDDGTRVELSVNSNDLAAGQWDYVCAVSGIGVDETNSKQTFTGLTYPELAPIADKAEYAADPILATYDPRAVPSFKNKTNDPPIHVDVDFLANVEGENYDGAIAVKWANNIVPQKLAYQWSIGSGNPDPSATENRAYSVHLRNSFQNTEYTCKIADLNDEVKNFIDAEELEKLTTVVFNVSVNDRTEQPVIEALQSYEKGWYDRTDVCRVAEGNILSIRARLNREGTGASQVARYYWSTKKDGADDDDDVNIGGGATSAPNDDGIQIVEDRENGGYILQVRNVTAELNNMTVSVYVENQRGATSDTISVKIETLVGAVPSPVIKTDPKNVERNLEITEGKTVAFTCREGSRLIGNNPDDAIEDDRGGINPEVLKYQWMVAQGQNEQTPAASDYVAVTDGNGRDTAQYTTGPMKLNADGRLTTYYYRCDVVNTARGSQDVTSSQIYTVTVLPQRGRVFFTMPEQEVRLSTVSGETQQLEVKAEIDDGSDTVSYQWRMAYGHTESAVRGNGTAKDWIEGATEPTLRTDRLEAGFYLYDCLAINTKDTSQSNTSPPFIIEVTQNEDAPIITYLSELEQGAEEGGSVRFRLRAETLSGVPPTYQWYQKSSAGELTAMPAGNRTTLTLANLESSQDNTQYVCRVTNPATDYILESRTFTLHVWKAADIPEILRNPTDLRVQKGTVGAIAAYLEMEVASSSGSNFAFTWQRLQDDRETWKQCELEPEELVGEDSTVARLIFTGADEEAGTYRCIVENLGGSPAGAEAVTSEAKVLVLDRNVPTILKEPVKKQYANVGKSAVLRVVADIEPEQPLSYTWMVTTDKGKTWRNATAQDGTGYDTSVFTTLPMHKNNVGKTLMYKCKIEGVTGGVSVETGTCQVIPKNPSPEMLVDSDSLLRITENPETNERFLTGQSITSKEDVLTRKLIDALFDDVIKSTGGKIEVTKNGVEMKEDDPIGTGCVVTLLDSKGVPLDEVEIAVAGDLLGTGEASISQLVEMAGNFKTNKKLTGSWAYAADLNGNGNSVDLSDVVEGAKLYKRIAGAIPTPTPDPSPSPSASNR